MLKKELPDRWRLVKLKEVAKIDNKAVSPDEMRGELQSYIGLENIESNTGRLVSFSETLGDDIKSNKFGFTEEHILYGKLRPYLNKVYLPDFAGVCSTDIIPIKPNRDLLIREFLGYFLRTPEFVSMINAKSSGANLPRVNPKALLDVYIPLPPIETQRQIVAILEKAEATQRLRAEADALMRKLVQSVFLDMFGDPISNSGGWELRRLGELCVIRRGASPRPIENFLGGTVPWIMISDISREEGIYLSKTAEFVTEEGASRSRHLKSGTLILSNSGTVCQPKILAINGCIHDGFLSIEDIKEDIDIIYVYWYFHLIRPFVIQRYKQGVTQVNLNTDIVKKFLIPVPPIKLQEHFTNFVLKTEECMSEQRKLSAEGNMLFNSLISKAFNGELSI